MQAETAPSAVTALPPRLSCVSAASSAESAAAVPVPWPSMSWMSAGSAPARWYACSRAGPASSGGQAGTVLQPAISA